MDAAGAVLKKDQAGFLSVALIKAEDCHSANSCLIYFRGSVATGMGNYLVSDP